MPVVLTIVAANLRLVELAILHARVVGALLLAPGFPLGTGE